MPTKRTMRLVILTSLLLHPALAIPRMWAQRTVQDPEQQGSIDKVGRAAVRWIGS